MAATWAGINEAFMILSAISVGFGWYHIRLNHRETHRKFMLTAVYLGAAFFVSYLLSTVFVGDAYFGGPKTYNLPYQIFLQVHVLLATAAAVAGIITLRYALRERFGKHKKIAPWTAIMWFIAAVTGLGVFLMLFVIFPPGPTTPNLVKILFH